MARGSERLADLVRMLNLLPYFEAHPERSVMEAARDLGREPQEIMDDLNRLWCCGLPGLMPGDLVDLQHSYQRVRVDNAQGMNKPLRLTTTEAAALLLSLENLESTPGLVDNSAVTSAAAKLRDIMGEQASPVADAVAEPGQNVVIDVIRGSMDQKRQLAFEYFSQTTFTAFERRASVAQVFTSDGNTYVRAWDHDVNEHRTFRVDRMSQVVMLDEPAQPHSEALKFSSKHPFSFGRAEAEILVAKDFAWIADYVPITMGEEVDEHWVRGAMPIGSEEWLIRFVVASAGQVKITAPTHLVQAVAQRAVAGLKAYNEPEK
ncbi:WYL domain-containing protein [Corynebacterium hindlerae]|uniref:helix-turn-helix transcriptional regulator n=1 Tax=Corynebacterium hindlerae TaxID=699041 RepID=UPI001AD790DF|nr:WYL domain-containing protein [Corynebacterium hindlerae]QTH58825.1 WYL domain-containing protein [Corynebacterium hindlerae]